MNRETRYRISILVAIVVLAALVGLTIRFPQGIGGVASLTAYWAWLPAALFAVLIFLTMAFGVLLVEGEVSLLPMTSVAACLVLGPIAAGWAAFVAAVAHGLVRYFRPQWLGLPARDGGAPALTRSSAWASAALTAANASMHTASVLVGGVAYVALGGRVPLRGVSGLPILPLLALGLAYLATNYTLAAAYIAARGGALLRAYLRSLPRLVFYEGSPLLFAPLMATIYTRLGIEAFLLFALILVAASLITRHLALTSRRLARRVQELDSLRAVGQALSASLDVETTLEAIYRQVVRLMPAHSFYVALYDAEADEVSFPLAVEDGERVRWRPRRAGNGLTEHVLRTGEPLLIRRDVEATVQALGLDAIGQPALSWLGVPLLRGPDPPGPTRVPSGPTRVPSGPTRVPSGPTRVPSPVPWTTRGLSGVIAVQSHSSSEAYDASHREILVTIAAQAAVAIENARLYARTDEALARRVQELGSILRTTHEGILLLDAECRVLAANRALADLLGLAQAELVGRELTAPSLHVPSSPDRAAPEYPRAAPEYPRAVSLAELIGYPADSLASDCAAVASLTARGEEGVRKGTITLAGAPPPPGRGLERGLPGERHVERSLAPVRDRQGAVSGWLITLRDVTEEIEHARLKEDMTRMLIHDLRSPLTVIKGSLDLIEVAREEGEEHTIDKLLAMARRSGEQLLHMVGELLDISRLEEARACSGQQPVRPGPVEAAALLEENAARVEPLLATARIALDLEVAPDLPPLYVDRSLVDRVLGNLLDNAIKFTPDGGRVRLWARLDPALAPDGMLIGVTDTGPGIPAGDLPRLFQKFHRVHTVQGRWGGTGLGLAFCKLAVEAHGGRIWVESQVGQGSTFQMALPVA